MTIDELTVELSLDPSRFTQGQRDALDSFKKTSDEFDKRLKGTQALGKDAGYSFAGMTNAAEGLFTTLGGVGMAAFARDAVNSAAATGRAATNIGITTKELSAFGRAIERNGGNADAAAGSMKSLADSMQNLKWGQASSEFLTGLSQVGGGAGDSPIDLFMKLAKFADTHTAQQTNQVGARLGVGQDVINEALRGSTKALEDYRKAFEGAVGDEQARKLTDAQRAWVSLGQAAKTTGSDDIAAAAPAFTWAASGAAKWAAQNRILVDSLAAVLAALASFRSLKLVGWAARLLFGAAAGPVGLAAGLAYANLPSETNAGEKDIYTPDGKLTDYGRKITGSGSSGAVTSGTGTGAFKSQAEKEAFIRATAAADGIDPSIAMAVARKEGFNQFSGDNGASFGAFQLHVTPGGHAVGDQFKKDTGLDPSDPANERATIDYALSWAKKHGWSQFFGAARAGVGAHQGIGDVNVSIQTINLPGVTDAKKFAKDLPGAIKDHATLAKQIANNANSGQRQ